MGSDVQKEKKLLGMNPSTARHRLKKMILFNLIQKLDLDVCYRCGKLIESIDDLSVEHIKPWMQSNDPKKMFFSLDNIAFSHLSCNIKNNKREMPYIELKCETCEKTFHRELREHTKRMKKGYEHIFCSRKCMGKIIGR